MKKIFGLLAAAFLCLSAPAQSDAAGQYGVYVTPKLIWGQANYSADHYSYNKSKMGGGIAVGYDMWNTYALPIRAELELAGYSKFNPSAHGHSMDVSATTLFANAYLDLHNSTAFIPYAQAGLGLAFLKGQFDDYKSNSASRFALNVGVGVAYQLTDNIAFDLGYRYASLGKASSYTDVVGDYIKSDRIGVHNIMLGARISF